MIIEANLAFNDEINNLGKQVNKNYEKLFPLEKIINSPYEKIFVYQEENKIIGFIHLNELAEEAEIINIVVAENNRKKGIGNQLLVYVIDKVKTKKVTLEVEIDNNPAIKLYKKNGFKILSIRKSYYNGKDAYLMGR